MENQVGENERKAAIAALLARHGEAGRSRIEEAVVSAAALWRGEDGDGAAFVSFCETWYCPEGPGLEALLERFSANLEEIHGCGRRMSRRTRWAVQVEEGELLPVDDLFAAWDPLAHVADDFFSNKLAFVARLNFPRKSLAEKLAKGSGWNRKEWARARLGEAFADRVPAAVQQDLTAAYTRAESYISAYNIHADCLVDAEGPLYAAPKPLLMHWNMRDEIKALYGSEGGLRRQRALYRAMERVVDGSLPKGVIDGRDLSWDPFANRLERQGRSLPDEAEGTARYAMMAGIRDAELGLDAACPEAPTLLARRFDLERELQVEEVEVLLESLFEGDSFGRAAAMASGLLGRPLEAFDVWFRGFDGPAGVEEADLDARTRVLFPDAASFGRAIPSILRALGFPPEEADWLGARIEVDPARGSGHAMPAAMRQDKVRLRTRVAKGGMDYKGYNIAMHELGHNVEEVYSLHGIDEYFLAGVPNNAFTEAFAFVFQARDLEVLAWLPGQGKDPAGQAAPAGQIGGAQRGALADYWATCEIAGVSLVDIGVWRWLYAHPGAGPGELREAVLDLSRAVWNRLFAPAFGIRDALVLGSYSHMIELGCYLPDYPLGHLVSFQIEDYLKDKVLGQEMGRMCRLGRLCPEEWMRQAVGGKLSAAPLVTAARRELEAQEARGRPLPASRPS